MEVRVVTTRPDFRFTPRPNDYCSATTSSASTRTTTWFRIALLALISALVACTGDDSGSPAQAAHPTAITFPTSCDPAIQADFDHAMTLLHHMTYPQARTAFREIAERDPDCAMAQWGIAMTLFQPLWPTRPSPQDLQFGWETVQKAQRIKKASAREQAFIAAAAAFFEEPAGTDYWQRIQRWQTAMAAAHAAFPQDQEATAFYALALLATGRSGPAMQEHAREAEALLVEVLRENPNHPGAMHYIIHANDVPGREHEDLEVVHEYEDIAPDNPHALHMPTHIYTRLGDWDGVIRGNLRAAEAALKYPAGEHGEFVWDEFAHAIEYLVYAYLQQGQDEQAAAQIARLLGTTNVEPTTKTTFHLASTRARYALERQDWAQAAAIVPREPAPFAWDRFPWAEAVMVFAHGYGSVRTERLDESRLAIARLGELEARASASGEEVFARQIKILRLELEAWTAHAAHDDDNALALLQQVVEIETSTPKPPVTPAPTLPAKEQLGDLFAELGRPGDALGAYRQSLQAFPRRFNGTLGAARALAATGDAAGAAQEYCALLQIAGNGSRPALQEARRFVKLHPPTGEGSSAADCSAKHDIQDAGSTSS
jgi:tetratricopeptide (TPR) repeat protein